MWPEVLLSSPIELLCSRETFRQLLSTLRATGGPSVNFCRLSVQPVDLPSTSVNIQCGQKAFRELSVWPGDLPSTSDNFQCDQETFCQLPSTFSVAEKFRQLPSTFRATGRSFIKIRQLSVPLGDIQSTLVDFPCGQNLPSTSDNFLCCRETIHQLSLIFHAAINLPPTFSAAKRTSVNF